MNRQRCHMPPDKNKTLAICIIYKENRHENVCEYEDLRNSLMCLNGLQTFPSLCVPDTNESILSSTQ